MRAYNQNNKNLDMKRVTNINKKYGKVMYEREALGAIRAVSSTSFFRQFRRARHQPTNRRFPGCFQSQIQMHASLY